MEAALNRLPRLRWEKGWEYPETPWHTGLFELGKKKRLSHILCYGNLSLHEEMNLVLHRKNELAFVHEMGVEKNHGYELNRLKIRNPFVVPEMVMRWRK